MAGLRLQAGEIPPKAMKYVLHGLCTIGFGEMVLVAQDGVLMQVEWNEKRRLDCWHDTADTESAYSEKALLELAARIRKKFRLLQYGKLVLVIRKGRLMQIERTEKQRFTGLDGEGI
ncbi:DUF2292 domain-containing protein [Mitsuokella sp.]|uniref:DUF2292 domain-containing protein n=1 Tax=Mitsuokella sp. TaxID=2049034 RepID=UPI003D7C3C62